MRFAAPHGGAWVPVLLAAAQVAASQAPTFAHDIAPIVYQYCAPCHRPGEAGPFPLLRYEDVRKRARQIVEVTRSRYMPPWLPEHGYGDFAGELRLSDAQIRLIAEWAAAGAPEGPPAAIPPPPVFTSGWQLGPPDMILEAPRAFTVPASGPDQFWNFIFKPPLKTRRYVRAVEIRPGKERLVHHANLLVDRAHWAVRQETTPGAGFPGMDLANERSLFDPDDGHFLFWKPGSTPYVEPDGLAWRLNPGDDLVLNAHLQPSGRSEQVRPALGLYFTDKPQTKFPMLVQLEHDGALNIPAGDPNFVVSDDFKLPLDVDILAVYPHAHYLGHLLEGYATLPDGRRKWLIRIPEWNFNWQAVYYYREPVFLPKGTIISMRFHYDNSAANPRNPNDPPRRVQAGNQATDEMGHLWLQALPRASGDHRMTLEVGLLQHRLEKYPDDFTAHLRLGALMLAKLNAGGAVTMAKAAVRIEPDNAEARNLLGSALVGVGRSTEAEVQFRQALRLKPDYVNARFNLAEALLHMRRTDAALAEFRRILAVSPDDALVKSRLEKALSERAGN
jgi:mono/diheme cytochrome c family protein